jgi:hypothetical protein
MYTFQAYQNVSVPDPYPQKHKTLYLKTDVNVRHRSNKKKNKEEKLIHCWDFESHEEESKMANKMAVTSAKQKLLYFATKVKIQN